MYHSIKTITAMMTILLIFGVGAVFGQADPEIEPLQPVPLYYDFSSPDIYNDDQLVLVVEAVDAQLAELGFVLAPTPTHQANLWRHDGVTLLVNGVGFFVEATNPDIELLSPMVNSSYDLTYNDFTVLPDLLVALALYHESQLDDAEDAFEPLIASDMSSPLHYYLGNIALLRDEYDAALGHYTMTATLKHWQAIFLASSEAWTLVQVGNIEAAKMRLTDAAEFVVTGSNEVSLAVAWAQFYALTFDYDSAIDAIDEAIITAEDNNFSQVSMARLFTTRGEIVFLIYEWDRVEADFNRAIDYDETYGYAYFQRGILFYTMARREDALSDFAMYLELAPDGLYAEQATTYIDSIETEIEALGG